jgi:hypothetical protein
MSQKNREINRHLKKCFGLNSYPVASCWICNLFSCKYSNTYLISCCFSMYGSCHDITPERCLTTTIKGSTISLFSGSISVTLTLGGSKVEFY